MSLHEESAAYRNKAQQMLGDKFEILRGAIDRQKASGLEGKALRTGDKAPLFTLPDADGKQVSLEALLAQGPVVLAFYRGEWCPFCNLELKAFQDVLPEIKAAGAVLIAVSPEKPEFSRLAGEKQQLTYPVLTDAGSTVSRQFGLVFASDPAVKDLSLNMFKNDVGARNADGTWDLPMPGTFVIDGDRTIRYAHVDADYMTGRAEPKDVVAVLHGLAVPA